MGRRFLQTFVLLLAAGTISAAAQSPCGPPTPGVPHVCVTWTAAATPPAITGYNVYRATASKGQNYGTPLNATPIPSTQLFFYDTTVAIGTTYFYTAVSVGTGGVLSVPSAEVQAQVPVPPNSPTTPAANID